VSLPGISTLEAAVAGRVVPQGSPGLEDVRKPAWAQFEEIVGILRPVLEEASERLKK